MFKTKSLFPSQCQCESTGNVLKDKSRECKHFAVSNLLCPSMPSHLGCLLSLFGHPKTQQTHCLSWPCVTDFYHLHVWQWWIRPKREGQQLCSLAQHLYKPQHRALSSYLHLMCQFYLPLWIETKGPDDQSLWLFPYHKQSEAKAAVAPRCTERLRQLYWALLFHYFYKICCSTFTNVLWSIINN